MHTGNLYSNENRCGSLGEIPSKLTGHQATHTNNIHQIHLQGKVDFHDSAYFPVFIFLSPKDASKTHFDILTSGFISVQANSLTIQKELLSQRKSAEKLL